MSHTEAVSLLVISVGAFGIPLLAGRIGLPSAVGEILFGVLVGPQILGILGRSEFIAFLAEFGFAFLMFLVGLELEFGKIEREGRRGIAAAVSVSVVLYAAALVATLLLHLHPYMVLVFGAVSVGILLSAMSEAGTTRTAAGQATILVASLAEFVTIVLLTGFHLYYRFGMGLHLVIEMVKLGVIFLAAYVVLVILRTLIWWRPASFARVVTTHDPSEVGVRAGMAMMLVFVALASLMGVESILGSFIAGALFSFVFREKGMLHTKMSSIGFGFFVPIFFISVGAGFNLKAVMRLDVVPIVGILMIVSITCKMLAAAPLLLRGVGLRSMAGAGLLMASPLTLLVVVSRIGQEIGVMDEIMAGATVLLAIVASVLFPSLYRALTRRQAPAAVVGRP